MSLRFEAREANGRTRKSVGTLIGIVERDDQIARAIPVKELADFKGHREMGSGSSSGPILQAPRKIVSLIRNPTPPC
jgi:hypothetical protein